MKKLFQILFIVQLILISCKKKSHKKTDNKEVVIDKSLIIEETKIYETKTKVNATEIRKYAEVILKNKINPSDNDKTSECIEMKNSNNEKNVDLKTALKYTIPKNVDTDFKLFLEFFNKDSIFQMSRVKFPIKIQDFNDEFELRERIITKDNYYLKKFNFSKINKTELFNEYKQKITLNDSGALIEINGIENGIACEFYFKKINELWMLISWVDQST